MKIKKVIAALIAGVLILSSGIINNATYEWQNVLTTSAVSIYGDFAYETLLYENQTVVLITEYSGLDKIVNVPNTINGHQVIGVGREAFYECDRIEKVILPDSIEYILGNAFQSCTNLKEVNIPPKVKSISKYAFSSCEKLEKVSMSEGLIMIEFGAFYHCTNLENISLPDSVIYVGGLAFSDTAWLNKQPDGPTYLGNIMIECKGDISGKTINIAPGTLSIAESAFTSSRMSENTKIIIPDSVKILCDNAFAHARMSEIVIPDSVEYLGNHAFDDCPYLKKVSIGKGCNVIRAAAFGHCKKLSEVTIPDTVEIIADSAFVECTSLISVSIGKKVTTIGGYCFKNCSSLETITGGTNIVRMGEEVFEGTKWLSDQPSGSVYLERVFYTYKGTKIPYDETLTIEDGTICIAGGALNYFHSKRPGFKTINLPNTLKYIGPSAFLGFDTIDSLFIPESVSVIDKTAFKSMQALKEITIMNPYCTIYDDIDTICNIVNEKDTFGYVNYIIYGYAGSTAEEYAKKYDKPFNIIGEVVTTTATTTTTTTTNTTTQKELKLSTDKITLKAGEQYTISANQTNLTYSSSNRSIAIVSANGVITALNDGKATISVFNSNYDVAQIQVTVSSVTSGDINGDNVISIADAVMLQKYLLGSGTLTNWKNADLCKDDRIDVFDMVLMRKLLIENN